MDDTSLKFRIQSRQITAGAMVFEFFSPGTAKILENAGAEFIVFDMEHTGLGFETLKWIFFRPAEVCWLNQWSECRKETTLI